MEEFFLYYFHITLELKNHQFSKKKKKKKKIKKIILKIKKKKKKKKFILNK